MLRSVEFSIIHLLITTDGDVKQQVSLSYDPHSSQFPIKVLHNKLSR